MQKYNPIRVNLGETFDQCPKCWQNFIDLLHEESEAEEFEDVPEAFIASKLKPYGAKYKENKEGYAHLVFKDEKDYTLFVLRYS